MDMKRLGEKLRAARVKAGLTQEQVAGERMATRTLQRLEDGEGNPTLATISELAEALGVPVVELLGGRESAGKAPIQPHYDPSPEELARILYWLRHAEPVTRLSALLLLTGRDTYRDQLRAIPGGAPFASVIEKLPRR